MRNIVYYVAVSLDGYISGIDGSIEGFVPDGNGVDRYLRDLKDFDTVIMGRNTYEFGYRFGLEPGQAAYPHMEHYIFSENLEFEDLGQYFSHIKAQQFRSLQGEKMNHFSELRIANWLYTQGIHYHYQFDY